MEKTGVIIMAFPKSRILRTQQLIHQIAESNRNGERFCFILGAGASVESGIPSGNKLEMHWMDCIMGVADDRDTPKMDAEAMRQCAEKLYKDNLIDHRFEEIEAAWRRAKESGGSIPSTYYFDIYKIRFFPHPRNGYRYLERIMENCEPSLGYHTLALMLTEKKGNNLVITTNFDSLVEDALFIYTDKKPLIVSHESLAGYIESDIQRPIIAKVHRGLMYAPFNSPETTNNLKDEWREALNYALSTYTPIVIGYGGGDHSLMAFLEEKTTKMRHGIYWCYRGESDLPDRNIQRLIEEKDGYFVTIDGFDALMMEIGKSLYKKEIAPLFTGDYLKNQYLRRSEKYGKQWNELNKKPEMQELLQPMNEEERQEEEKREKEKTLTASDYLRRGNRAYDNRQFEDAIAAYTKAIELDSTFTIAYSNRGASYGQMGEYEKEIADCEKAIEISPDYANAYNNRGFAYNRLNQKEKAFRDYTTAIELNPNSECAYSNRGAFYNNLQEYEKAIEDCTKSIELNPCFAEAYNNRGFSYQKMDQYEKGIKDYTKAIALNPNYRVAYSNRASLYRVMGLNELAEEDEKAAAKLQ